MSEPSPHTVDRRQVLRWAGTAGMLGITTAAISCVPTPRPGDEGSNEHSLVLAAGFSSRVIAVGGQRVAGTSHTYGIFPDGGATFVDPEVSGGWYYVANHEVPFGGGGVTSFRFAPNGRIVDAFPICEYTSLNCAGGPTPWGTWLTCEEFDGGAVWECDPTRPRSAVRRQHMGLFAHEAAAVASDDRVYMTEDRPDGGFYRFTPETPGNLRRGVLEIACAGGESGRIEWRRVPDVLAAPVPCRYQVDGALRFQGGEGIATNGTTVWFTTKGDNRIWAYDLATQRYRVHVDGKNTILSGVDNLWHTDIGGDDTLLVAEDGGDLQIVAVGSGGSLSEVVRIVGHVGSELAGPALSPDGTRLYFSSQRGPTPTVLGPGAPTTVGGITYEVTGPFRDLLG